MLHIRKAQELQWQLIRARNQQKADMRREAANRNASTHRYKVGDFILVKNLAPAAKGEKKLRAKYLGPYRILHVYPTSLVVIPWGDQRF